VCVYVGGGVALIKRETKRQRAGCGLSGEVKTVK
jgi:hypothetical protein